MADIVGFRVKENDESILMIDRVAQGHMTRSMAIKKILSRICTSDDYLRQILDIP